MEPTVTETVSWRRRWWLENKDDPRIREGFRASNRRYYEKNKEAERERKRLYYHQKKNAREGAKESDA